MGHHRNGQPPSRRGQRLRHRHLPRQGQGTRPSPPIRLYLRLRQAPPAASGSAETDREALVALYNTTNGENWHRSDNWLSDAPLGEWEGVVTNDDGRVTELNLNDNRNLGGELPAALGNLSNLTVLGLHGNDLSGEIPPWLGSLSNLKVLDLSENFLNGCALSSLEDQLTSSVVGSGFLPFC